jgi:hypothetical protein
MSGGISLWIILDLSGRYRRREPLKRFHFFPDAGLPLRPFPAAGCILLAQMLAQIGHFFQMAEFSVKKCMGNGVACKIVHADGAYNFKRIGVLDIIDTVRTVGRTNPDVAFAEDLRFSVAGRNAHLAFVYQKNLFGFMVMSGHCGTFPGVDFSQHDVFGAQDGNQQFVCIGSTL